MSNYNEIVSTLIEGDANQLATLVKEALDSGSAPKNILNDGLIKGMDLVGEKMQTGEMFIPEVLRSANAMRAVMQILKPLLSVDEINASGTVIIGTVKGDLHDIGKNLVGMMLETVGFEVVDLGVDVAPEAFVDAVKSNGANAVALSALLTTTMPSMKKTIEALAAAGMKDDVIVIIGGSPVTQKYADEIGADGYSADAGSACKLLKGLVG